MAAGKGSEAFRKRLYVDHQGGAISCYDHLGGYGQAQVMDDPNAGYWLTSLNLWIVMTDKAIRELESDDGLIADCETCHRTLAQLRNGG